MTIINKSIIVKSLAWKFLERTGTQGIQFVIQIFLARLLMPEDYGIIALITIFINIATIFIQSGLNLALIQKKDADETDFSTVFYFSLAMSCLVYVTFFLLAPTIASFYQEEILSPIIRVLSINIIFAAINSVQNALISKQMGFKKQFFAVSVGTIVYGVIGIIMAYFGFGVWSLVLAQLLSALCNTGILWFSLRWRPQLVFSFEKLEKMFSFSLKMMASSFLATISENLYGLIIGKVYNSQILGFYNRGSKFPSIIATSINGSVSAVIYPVLSSKQDNKEEMKQIVRQSVKLSSFVIMPVMMGLISTAEPIVKYLLTEKWLPCVPFIWLVCAEYAFASIQTANLQAYAASGKSNIILKMEFIKNVLTLIALFIGLQFGIYIMVALKSLTSLLMLFINAYPSSKLLNYNYNEQVQDIMPNFFISFLMAIIVYYFKYLPFAEEVNFILQLIAGVITYFLLAAFLKNESFIHLLDILKSFKHN